MGWIADQLEGKAPRISEDRVKELSESTTLSDIAAIPFAALGTGLDALSYPADAARAAVGRLAGVRGSGRETFFGTAPSGRELLGLGPGREGSFEASDIPAALAVGAIDPLWMLPVGKLSKVGELAQRAGNLERAAQAYKTSGKAAEAISELNALRGVQSELRAAGASGRTRLAPTLAEQAKLGQRSLISLGLPGMESVPLVRGAGAFAALGKAGALAGKVTNPLFESIFRTESRISPKTAEAAAEQLGLNARDAAAMYGASSDVETEGIRAGLRITDDEASRTARFIAERKDSTAALRAALHPEIQDAYRKAGSYYATKIAEANAQGFVGKANRLKMEAEDTFRRLDASAGLDAGNPTWKQLGFAVERAETRAQMGEYVGKLVRERESKLAPIRARMAALAESRDPERLARKVALLEDMLANTNDYKEIASIRKQVRELGRFVPGTSTWIPNERGALLKEISSIVTKAQNGFSKADAAKMAKFQAAAQRVEADYAGKIAIGIAHGRIAKAGLKTIPPEVIEEAKRIAAANGNMLDEVRLSGAPAPELADQYISYLARKADPNGVELLQRLKGKVPDAFERVVAEMNRAGGGSSIQRVKEFEGLGVSQINDWFRSALRDAGAPNITDDVRLFEENPAEIMLRKLTADFKRAANARFQQSIISTFMVPNSAKRFGDVPLEEFIKTGRLAGLTIGKNVQFGDDIAKGLKEVGLDGMYIPKDIAAAALRTNKILDDPEELKGILGFVDKYNQLARFGVTQLFPSFHVRNAVSNSFMMWMGGMRDPSWMAKAAKVQMESTMPHNAALLKRAHDLGVIGTGMSDEIRKLQASKAGGLFEKYVTPVTKKVSKVGGAIEDNAKLAMFMDGRAKGLSDSEAAARVKKYLFDYGDLSRVEKKYLRRWAFFYTYQRKIVPLVAQELAKHPIVGSLYNRVTGNYEGSIQNEIMPEWQRNQGNIYLGNDSEGNATFANLDLPLSSIYDLAPEGKGIGRSLQKLAGMAAPMPKMILEAGAGVNLRSGRPRQGGLGEILLANSPAARFSSTTSALADSLLGDGQRGKPADVALSLVGLPTIRRMDTIESRKRRLRDRVEMALEKLASEGEAYRRLEYSPTQSGKDVAPLNTLLSELKRSRLK